MRAATSSPRSRRSKTPRIPLLTLLTVLILLGLFSFGRHWILSPPKNLVHDSEAGSFGINLSWQAADLTKTFSLYRAESDQGPWTRIAIVGVDQYTDMNISSGKTYYYQVRSRGLLTEGKASPWLMVATPEIMTWSWESGNSYTGSFTDGKMSGQGTFTWQSGSVYTGQYAQGQAQGEGLLTWANQDSYEGQFTDGLPHGHGVYIWANGDKYTGYFAAGLRSGQGIYAWATGYRYEGQWQNNLRHGQGKYFSPSNRLLLEGTWVQGNFDGSQN